MLMPVQPRAARGLGVIAVPYANVGEADGGIELGQCISQPGFADDIVARHVNVASINARRHRQQAAQAFQNLRHVLERAAQRMFGTGGVFDEHGQARAG